MEMVRFALVVALAGLTDSQLPPLEVLAAAVKDSANPGMELATVTVCAAGWVPPC